jgi:hypothetical protein
MITVFSNIPGIINDFSSQTTALGENCNLRSWNRNAVKRMTGNDS